MKRTSRHRGFAMVTAIFLIGFTAMTVTEIGLTIAVDAQRTRYLGDEAQLRQFVLAANEFALQHPAAGTYQMPTPAQVEATVTIDMRADHTADVEAKLPGRRMSEEVSLAEINGVWQISQATLN